MMGYEGQKGPRLTEAVNGRKFCLSFGLKSNNSRQNWQAVPTTRSSAKSHPISSVCVAPEEALDQKKWRLYVPRQKKVAQLFKSYVARRNQEREAFAHISGRKGIRARFVQGGAPGSGKK